MRHCWKSCSVNHRVCVAPQLGQQTEPWLLAQTVVHQRHGTEGADIRNQDPEVRSDPPTQSPLDQKPPECYWLRTVGSRCEVQQPAASQPILPAIGPSQIDIPENLLRGNNELSPPLALSCSCMTQQVQKIVKPDVVSR